MAIFLNYASNKIKGSATDAKFKDQIIIESFQWGSSVAVAPAGSKGTNRINSKASVSEIVLTKQADKASQGLFKALLKGDHDAKCVISFANTSNGESVVYAQLDLENVIISSFSQSSGGDLPTESLSLNFTKFDWTWNERDDKGKPTPTHLVYSLVEAKVS